MVVAVTSVSMFWNWAAHCRRQPLLRILREKALQHWARIRASRPQAMDQRPIGEKQVLGPGVRAARRLGHAEATLSSRPTQRAEPEACPLRAGSPWTGQ
jgi:hypothetical protein